MKNDVDIAPCGLLSFSDDGVIMMANTTLKQLLGHQLDSIDGQPLTSIMSAASRIFYQTHFYPLLKLQGKVEELYLSLKTKTGVEVPVLLNASRREKNGIVFNDCAFIPIRQRIEFEERLLQARKLAEVAIQAKNLATAKLEQAHAELEIRQAEQIELNARLEVLATTDALTGLKNRRVFQDTLAEKILLQARHPAPLSLLLIDVDHFKRINDTFSHLVGDQVLKVVAKILQKSSRTTDVVSRYGGEEFAIILPETDRDGAIEIAERLRIAIETTSTTGAGVVTISIGAATVSPAMNEEGPLLAAADRALYFSKKHGRNRSTHADSIAA